MPPSGSRSQAALVLPDRQSTLRFNPDYELVRLERLSAEQREPLAALQQGSHVLRHSPPALCHRTQYEIDKSRHRRSLACLDRTATAAVSGGR